MFTYSRLHDSRLTLPNYHTKVSSRCSIGRQCEQDHNAPIIVHSLVLPLHARSKKYMNS